MLGILTLDTHFPRIPGDIGAPETFAFPVRIVAVTGAEVEGVVLECANMPPYRDMLARHLGLPVFDAAQATAWFYGGLPGVAPRCGRSDLW